MESIISLFPTTAANGKPPAIPLAKVVISGETPTVFAPNISPVLPKPVWTSSKINNMPFFLAIFFNSCKKYFEEGIYPPSPSCISTTNAATSSISTDLFKILLMLSIAISSVISL